MNNKFDVSIIIPCYNEEDLLEENVKIIYKTMNQTKYNYEIILVDDFSCDTTRKIIKKMSASNNNLSYVFHDKNYGRGKTVRTGIVNSSGKYVGFLDIDLEIHSRYIPSMINGLESGYDVSIAYRIYKLDFTFKCFIRHILSYGYRKLLKLITDIKTKDTETGYKFFNRQKILPFIEQSYFNGWFWDTEIMYLCEKNNLKIKEIECLFMRNNKKHSKLKVIPDTIEYLKNISEFKRLYYHDKINKNNS